MTLNFPHQPDVQLENSPLAEVVCQVRFPLILRIASEDPSEFQERVRDEFPSLEVEQGLVIRAPGAGAQNPPTAELQPGTYRFRTADEGTTISLAADFYAVSTTRYRNWEGFARYLRLTADTMQDVYRPGYSTRIGVRYINRLTPANTGCQTVAELCELLRPELTSHSRSESWTKVAEMRSRLLLVDDGAKLTLSTAYGEDNGSPFFLLDFDYFEEGRLKLNHLMERCSHYNEVIYRAFRWCIREEKLEVFRPRAKALAK